MYRIIPLLLLFSTPAGSAYEPISLIDLVENYFRLPRGLINAVGKVESSSIHTKYSPHDGGSPSYGLLQIKRAAAMEMGFKGPVKKLLNANVNVYYGAAYLAKLHRKTAGDLARTLTCYNSGPNSAACRLGVYGKYAGKVLNAWRTQ